LGPEATQILFFALRKQQVIWPILVSIFLIFVQPAGAALPPDDGMIYTFQADDTLRKLSMKYFDDALAYPTIIEATNLRVGSDPRFATTLSAETIQLGQHLFIPAQPLARDRFLQQESPENPGPSPEQLDLLDSLAVLGKPPELQNQTWLNSDPLKLAELRGQVVIVEFWTYG
jgi:hypothetical protein